MPRYIVLPLFSCFSVTQTSHLSWCPLHPVISSESPVISFSPTLILLSAIHLCLFIFSISWDVREVVLHAPGSLAALGVCLSFYRAAVYDGLGLHGSLCFMWTVPGCVSAGGVVGPVSHYGSCRNLILLKLFLSVQSVFGHFCNMYCISTTHQ